MLKNIHDNPVGSIKKTTKDIYIIRNTINDMVYIGQSCDVKEIFKSHCRASCNTSLLSYDMRRFGKKYFYYEILEYSVLNYDEREEYWIKHFNSLTPNGYNIQNGGSNPPTYYGIDCPTSMIKRKEHLKCIKDDLIYTKLSLSEIAKKNNISKRTILQINQGVSYSSLKEEYPLRKISNTNGKLTNKDALVIIEVLKYTYRQYEDIAKQFNVRISTIKEINSGKIHHINSEVYPIRKYKNSGRPSFTYEQVTEIIRILKETTISIRNIAKQYNVKVSQIMSINNGSAVRYKRDNEEYPIRKI